MTLENLVDSAKTFVKNNKSFCAGTTALIAAGIADCYCTSTQIKDITEEGNPIARLILENYGMAGLVTLKTAAVPVNIYVAKKFQANAVLYFAAAVWTYGALSWYIWR
ncbi:MAG: hypothetical protein AABW48_06130 [Nanoarchaeota archaeon]